MNFRTGFGFDVHRFAEGRALMLGGVEIPFPRGLAGHSDADVLLHAICDALLGAIGEGDIGALFPDHDPQYKNIDSRVLLRTVGERLRALGWQVGNVDSCVVCEAPKIAPHREEMRKAIAAALALDEVDRIGVKATTSEGLGFTGRGEGICAYATALVFKI